jgi:hypothetical protein
MKNQYFGDEKDYLTYGLLRALARSTGLRIGIAWMLTPDQASGEGELRGYLSPTQRLLWEHYDPELYERLAQVEPASRKVELARTWNLIPGARYDEPVHVPIDTHKRAVYFKQLLAQLKDCDLLFFDPDNGLEIPSLSQGARRSPQHLYWDEVELAYTGQRHSVLIFQHFPRRGRAEYLAERALELARRLNLAQVDWFQTAQVAFFLAARPEHAAALQRAPAEVLAHWRGRITHGVFARAGEVQGQVGAVSLEPPVELAAPPASGRRLRVFPGRYAVYRLAPDAPPPAWARGPVLSITRTPAELSIVCEEQPIPPVGARVEPGWRVLQVAGPLDFSLTGVLAALAAPLAAAGIPIFALSTFDTDYLLVKQDRLEAALDVLRAAGHSVDGTQD